MTSGAYSPSLENRHRHWKTNTVTAALRTSGLTATALFDGPITGARFRSYVEEPLVPALGPGATVILDNLKAHNVTGVREVIETAGAKVLYLPPYSPDFNPIRGYPDRPVGR